MATGKEIKAYVKQHYGFVPDDCWIAHARVIARSGSPKVDADISSPKRRCSVEKQVAIFQTLEHLGL